MWLIWRATRTQRSGQTVKGKPGSTVVRGKADATSERREEKKQKKKLFVLTQDCKVLSQL